MKLKIGARYVSQACDTEVIVVRAPADEVDLRCAGWPMVMSSERPSNAERKTPVAELCGGSALGKRYTDPDGTTELLVVKAGAGTLALGDTPLEAKQAKALPSSD